MTTMFEMDVTCPLCERTFAAMVVGSTNNLGPRTTDLRQFPAGADPLPHLVSTCPACGFSGLLMNFGVGEMPPRSDPAPREVALKVQEQISPLVTDQPPDAARRYEWAAQIAEWGEHSSLEVGWLYLNAAWCADDENQPDRARELRLRAMHRFEHALDSGQSPGAERSAYTYLIGELHRRTGNNEGANTWFERAIAADDGDWSELARRQQSNPRDLME